VLRAYSIGLFPMAESADDPSLFWVDPPQSAASFRSTPSIVSRSLAKTVRSDRFEVVVDHDFDAVIDGCARRGAGERTWINPRNQKRLYRALFDQRAMSTPSRRGQDGALVGGLYGVSIGAAFFGESMFHRARDASKVALVHLVARLVLGGWRLLDAQFVTDHLASLGAIEIAREDYRRRLAGAIAAPVDAGVWDRGRRLTGREALAAACPRT
jgi:leucyl/phenylalanyl-tRNA--protein transferase